MDSKKKADLQAGLAEILMNETDESSFISDRKYEPVSLAPDQTVQTPFQNKSTTKKNGDSPVVVVGSKMAQQRISTLEAEVDRLRSEAEVLKVSESALKRQVQEFSEKAVNVEGRLKQNQDDRSEELKNLKEAFVKKENELSLLRNRIAELESRLQNDFKRIRVKERELQNRIELMKLENGAVVKTKDDLILDLKRQMDQTNYEMDSLRKKTQNITQQMEDQQDRIKKSVKALRVAVSLLDGDESQLVLKKAE